MPLLDLNHYENKHKTTKRAEWNETHFQSNVNVNDFFFSFGKDLKVNKVKSW